MLRTLLELFEEAPDDQTPAGGGTALTGDDDKGGKESGEGGDTDTGAGDDKAKPEDGKKPEGEGDDDGGKDAGEKKPGESSEDFEDFDLPEGITADDELLKQAKPLFKELGLNQEQAQKLVSMYADRISEVTQGQVESFNQLTQDWLNQAQSDKEFGGDKFDESIQDARAAINKFGTPELKQLMDETGVGNHPEVIRMMTKVGKLLREDNPGTGGNPTSQPTDRVSILYPSDSEK